MSQLEGDGIARAQRSLGRGILYTAPFLMKTLSVVGTAAMFLVGGGILVHGIPATHGLIETLTHAAQQVPIVGNALVLLTPLTIDALMGITMGGLILGVMTLARRLRP